MQTLTLDPNATLSLTISDHTHYYRITAHDWDIQELQPDTALITPYSQRDPRWIDLEFAPGVKFGTDGCYVTAVTMITSLAGYHDTPPTVALKLHAAGCFTGAYLSRATLIPQAYPNLRYDGPNFVSRDGPLRWHKCDADVERFRAELAKGPVIAEIDYHPGGKFNQHFVVVEDWAPDGEDLCIIDPWDGAYTRLMQRYGRPEWTLERALYGVRLLRPAQEP